ncbi:unnamed protein product [Agarophyton chilense]
MTFPYGGGDVLPNGAPLPSVPSLPNPPAARDAVSNHSSTCPTAQTGTPSPCASAASKTSIPSTPGNAEKNEDTPAGVARAAALLPQGMSVSTAPRTSRTRGANYTTVDDVLIARSWLSVSEDPISETEQKSNAFFDRTHSVYTTMKDPFSTDRNYESVKSRVKLLLKECVKLAGCPAPVRRAKPTVVSEGDIIKLATGIYNNGKMGNIHDPCGRDFRFMEAWKVLKEYPKFTAGFENRRDDTVHTTEDANTQAVRQNGTALVLSGELDATTERTERNAKENVKTRPIGRRKAKELQTEEATSTKKLHLITVPIDLQRARNGALERYNDILLFSSCTMEGNSAQTKEFFDLMRSDALSRVRRRIGKEERSVERPNGEQD